MKGINKEILTGSVVCLSAIFAITTLAFSWFNNIRTGSVEDFTIGTRDIRHLMISETTDFSRMEGKLTFELEDDFVLDHISGNGINFFYPIISPKDTILSDGSTLRTLTLTGYEDITDHFSEYCIYKDFYLQVNKDLNLYLDSSSCVFGKTNNASDEIISGAVRVAFYMIDNDNGNKTLTCIWIPNPTYEYNMSSNGKITYKKDGSVEDSYVFANSTDLDDKIEIVTEGIDYGFHIENDVIYCWGDISKISSNIGDITVGSLEKDVPQHYAICVWIDGTDRECEKELMGKTINFEIDFKVYES